MTNAFSVLKNTISVENNSGSVYRVWCVSLEPFSCEYTTSCFGAPVYRAGAPCWCAVLVRRAGAPRWCTLLVRRAGALCWCAVLVHRAGAPCWCAALVTVPILSGLVSSCCFTVSLRHAQRFGHADLIQCFTLLFHARRSTVMFHGTRFQRVVLRCLFKMSFYS